VTNQRVISIQEVQALKLLDECYAVSHVYTVISMTWLRPLVRSMEGGETLLLISKIS